MLYSLTTKQILDLAYTKGQTFDAIAFAEKIAELERRAVIDIIHETLKGDFFRAGMLTAVIRSRARTTEKNSEVDGGGNASR